MDSCGYKRRSTKKKLELRKVLGDDNPSDMLTKHVSEKKRDKYCHFVSCCFREGRALAGLDLQGGKSSDKYLSAGNQVVCSSTGTFFSLVRNLRWQRNLTTSQTKSQLRSDPGIQGSRQGHPAGSSCIPWSRKNNAVGIGSKTPIPAGTSESGRNRVINPGSRKHG